MTNAESIPAGLTNAIREGRCVAFLGAGFSAAAGLPSWEKLLHQIASLPAIQPEMRNYIVPRLEKQRADWNEEAAQLLDSALGRDHFVAELQQRLRARVRPLNKDISKRLRLLQGIPFRTVLTTNFDDVLVGEIPGPKAYGRALQAGSDQLSSLYRQGIRWVDSRDRGPTIIKLHGDVDDPSTVVFSRLDYRRRLYSNSSYLGFLRSVFLYNTVLYLGFSFTDNYLNELRSEMLAMLGDAREDRPTAYAVSNDVPEPTRKHFRDVEGVEILSYDTNGGKNFHGFDRILKEIHDATSPVVRFGRLLQRKRILWVDPDRSSVSFATKKLFVEADRLAGNQGHTIEFVDTADEGLARLDVVRGAHRYDLVISRWGYVEGGESTAECLLQGMRKADLRAPVIIFASKRDVPQRKRIALGLGAQGYFFSWEGLFRGIEHVFDPGLETG